MTTGHHKKTTVHNNDKANETDRSAAKETILGEHTNQISAL